ncbi:MAG: YihY/virulence factor BrkB family protein [Chloroflexi bacterium]|nr:YihY/virulence factor BrkB family protein [Chloroflexota bacterium]
MGAAPAGQENSPPPRQAEAWDVPAADMTPTPQAAAVAPAVRHRLGAAGRALGAGRDGIRGTWHGSPHFFRTPATVIARTIRLYFDDNGATYSAAIAYYALFSIIPLSLITLSVLGLVVDRQQIVDFIFNQLPLEKSPAVQEDVNTLVSRAQDMSIAGLSFGVLGLLWSGSGVFAAVRRGLNATGHRPGLPYWHGKLIDIGLIPALAVFIWLSLSLTATLQVVLERTVGFGPLSLGANPFTTVLSRTIFGIPSFLMFAFLYRFIPTVRPGWSESLAGAAFATLLFELLKNLGAAFVASTPFSKDTAVYASFSTAFAFLFWMYVNATILLLGSEFVRSLGIQRQMTSTDPLAVRERRRFWSRSKTVHT